jgi:hypothetical protein
MLLLDETTPEIPLVPLPQVTAPTLLIVPESQLELRTT